MTEVGTRLGRSAFLPGPSPVPTTSAAARHSPATAADALSRSASSASRLTTRRPGESIVGTGYPGKRRSQAWQKPHISERTNFSRFDPPGSPGGSRHLMYQQASLSACLSATAWASVRIPIGRDRRYGPARIRSPMFPTSVERPVACRNRLDHPSSFSADRGDVGIRG